MASIAEIEQAVAKGIDRWKVRNLFHHVNLARENVTGKVLKRRSGRLAGDIGDSSRVTDDGFFVRTTLIYGIAWQKGFNRKGFGPAQGRPYRSQEFASRILPAKDPRASLRFKVGGQWVFARRVKPKKFKARPFLELDNQFMDRTLSEEIEDALKFEGINIPLEIRI